MDHALLAGLRRQQELVWTEGLVEHIEDELEAAGILGRPGRVPAMVFLDLVGYTRLTEEQGDEAAAQLSQSLALLVSRSARGHGGVPIKWLGDGVMVHFREPTGALRSALDLALICSRGVRAEPQAVSELGGRPPNCQSWISTLAYNPART
jgi:adenylate cyclase